MLTNLEKKSDGRSLLEAAILTTAAYFIIAYLLFLIQYNVLDLFEKLYPLWVYYLLWSVLLCPALFLFNAILNELIGEKLKKSINVLSLVLALISLEFSLFFDLELLHIAGIYLLLIIFWVFLLYVKGKSSSEAK